MDGEERKLLIEIHGKVERIDERTRSIEKSLKCNDAQTQKNTERIEEIEKRPVKWWDNLISAIIAAIATFIFTYFIKR